jgi:cob(I)alamin adenosyltransferase
MSDKNPDLVELSKTLNELASELHQKKAATNDTAQYVALNNELFEVNHRITMVGGLIFAARADEIIEAAKRVEDSKSELAEAIEEIEKINQFITAISRFLGLVDSVIDLAKRF